MPTTAVRSFRGSLADRLPAAISLRLRAQRDIRRCFGLHEPADLLTGLVPPGRNAVDVGANRGIYACWMTKRARTVHAFEPQPALAAYIRAARLPGLTVHEVALSDHEGSAELLVPADDGLARLEASDGGDPVAERAEAELGPRTAVQVRVATLDSLDLQDVGFLKIDAEGHEMAVLRGARRTIAASRPVVFVESEARHAARAPGEVIDLILGEHRYRRAAFVRRWSLVDIGEFDLERDQLSFLPDFRDPAYVGNFVFWP